MSEEELVNDQKVPSGITFSRVFWATILLMIAINAGFYFAPLFLDDDTDIQQSQADNGSDSASNVTPQRYTPTVAILREASIAAIESTVNTLSNGDFVDNGVDRLFGPVYDSVDEYVDMHFTVRGGYTELWASRTGDRIARMREMLFKDFDIRENNFANAIDREFNAEYERNFDASLQQELPDGVQRSDLSAISEHIIEDSLDRIKVSAPVSTLASASGTIGAKIAAQKLSAQFVAALAVKTGGKLAAKSGLSVLGGAAAGAAGGAVLGPVGAAIGGAGAAIGIWLGVDKLFVEADEFFNRDSFEAELIAMIDESKAAAKDQYRVVIKDKADTIERFTLRELSDQ